MTTTIVRVILAPRERQVVEGLADGSTLSTVARNLKIRQGTASGYLKFAKRKLHGVSENAAALAVGYTTGAITRPDLLAPETLDLPREQRDLVPLIARGMTIAQMATELKQSPGTHPVKPAGAASVTMLRRNIGELTANLQARNRAHLITRAWQYQILTADQVTAWLR
ncbi:LuxR C-terminal-related transcriptional regulator [Streptomyces sp. NPDC059943]|uniref:LuxR C-terminal-related transcriptional regulator n=1 Tax=Streptomyces sp. NPDC059943 TaxID=3347010 RepID=UPI003649E5C6